LSDRNISATFGCDSRVGQIVEILKDAESGVPVADLLRKHGVTKATFFKWRASTVAPRCRTRVNASRDPILQRNGSRRTCPTCASSMVAAS